jgi:hypothetical protein
VFIGHTRQQRSPVRLARLTELQHADAVGEGDGEAGGAADGGGWVPPVKGSVVEAWNGRRLPDGIDARKGAHLFRV